MEISISRKLEAVSMICLMIATTLAWGATLQTKPVITAANAFLNGNFANETTTDLATKLHNASVAVSKFATAALNDGTITKMDTEVKQKKRQFLGSVNDTHVREIYEAVQDLGYQGSYDDFSRKLKSLTQEQKQKAYTHGTSLGFYTLLVHISETYEELSKKLSSSGSLGHPTLTYASFHWTPPLAFLLPETCSGLDAGFGFLLVYGSIATGGVLTPWYMAAAGIWFGPARAFLCP